MFDLTEIRSTFEFLDDWEDRYRFLLDLGKQVPILDESARVDTNLVRGCQSQVWLITDFDTTTNLVSLHLDSDAHIVKGLIAVVLAAYNGNTPGDILEFDIDRLFDDLDLINHLSSTRGNGLRAMVLRIQNDARRLCVH